MRLFIFELKRLFFRRSLVLFLVVLLAANIFIDFTVKAHPLVRHRDIRDVYDTLLDLPEEERRHYLNASILSEDDPAGWILQTRFNEELRQVENFEHDIEAKYSSLTSRSSSVIFRNDDPYRDKEIRYTKDILARLKTVNPALTKGVVIDRFVGAYWSDLLMLVLVLLAVFYLMAEDRQLETEALILPLVKAR